MNPIVEVLLPDIGQFKNVDVIGVLVVPGETITPETTLITLETDKATLEVPAPQGGQVHQVLVKVGDKVSKGDRLITLAVAPSAESSTAPPVSASPLTPLGRQQSPSPNPAPITAAPLNADVVVLGAGPGGYTATFRAADLGLSVILVERGPTLGGVCLNVGCIPSKALLHVAKVMEEAAEMSAHGVTFAPPQLDLPKLRNWKASVVGRLTQGLAGLAKQRRVKVVTGEGHFTGPHQLEVTGPEGRQLVTFRQAIIAAGSEPVTLPTFPADPRVMDSTGALALADVPAELLVVGGGIIGLEMATVYHALGSRVTVVELSNQLIPGCDADLVKPLHRRLEKRYAAIHLATKVASVVAGETGLIARLEGPKGSQEATFDRVLVAVGRRPNGNKLGLAAAGVTVNPAGFIPVNAQQQTNVPHIYAIGDIVGQPMLAHKATHEGKVAAEVAAGHKSAFVATVIPSVAYTDPEVAWVGLTETAAKEQGIVYEKGVFPWAASGRSLSLGREEGLTKLLFDPASGRLLGAGLVGPGAGELIAEAALAIEMGVDAQDLALTIHPHPTLSETVAFAAEAFEGTLTDLYLPKSKTAKHP